MSELDVLVVGGVGVDTMVSVPALPVPYADTVLVPPMTRSVGHTGSGWALALHSLGLRTHLVDLVGDDPEADFARRRFAEAGLSFGYAVTAAGTKRSVNLVDPAGARMSFYDGRGQALGDLDPRFVDEPLGRARHVHVSINDWTRAALRRAVGLGRTVSTDLHDWDGSGSYHDEFAYAADVVLFSQIAAAEPSELVDRIFRHGRAQVVVTTAGACGATVRRRGAGAVHVPAVTVPGRPVVDSNGAGDAFGAAFLQAWLRGADDAAAARAGAVAGAWACSSYGSHADPITADRLAAYLADLAAGGTPGHAAG